LPGNSETVIIGNALRSVAKLGDALAKPPHKTVLFLCTGNYFRSRFAEIIFNHVATKFGLSWKASSRALASEPATRNVGPMAVVAIKALEHMGIRASADFGRLPQEVTSNELDYADFIVALKQTEHMPRLQERFAASVEKVEFWDVDDDPKVLGLIEKEVMDLIARLISGGKRSDAPVQQAEPPELTTSEKKNAKANGTVVRVGRETKGRRGKGVTTISDVPLDEAGLQELASSLKQTCGTGGTVKDGRIEIQGDQRRRIGSALESMGYRVKQSGG
jgi:predicted translation initiation factor SUI1